MVELDIKVEPCDLQLVLTLEETPAPGTESKETDTDSSGLCWEYLEGRCVKSKCRLHHLSQEDEKSLQKRDKDKVGILNTLNKNLQGNLELKERLEESLKEVAWYMKTNDEMARNNNELRQAKNDLKFEFDAMVAENNSLKFENKKLNTDDREGGRGDYLRKVNKFEADFYAKDKIPPHSPRKPEYLGKDLPRRKEGRINWKMNIKTTTNMQNHRRKSRKSNLKRKSSRTMGKPTGEIQALSKNPL